MTSRYEGDPIPCPHCPDGHQRPDWARWGVFVSPHLLDGQPHYLIVSRADGAHVAEADADYIRRLINAEGQP